MGNSTNNEIQLMSIKTLSRTTDFSVRQLQRLTRCGLIPKAMKLSGSLRWRRSDILLFLDSECDMTLFNERNQQMEENNE